MNPTEDPKLLQIVERLKPEFHPIRIFLFGSRASGNATETSDFDLVLVVEKSEKSQLGRMDQARFALRELNIEADVFVYTQEEFDSQKFDFNSIPETALSTGLELRVG